MSCCFLWRGLKSWRRQWFKLNPEEINSDYKSLEIVLNSALSLGGMRQKPRDRSDIRNKTNKYYREALKTSCGWIVPSSDSLKFTKVFSPLGLSI